MPSIKQSETLDKYTYEDHQASDLMGLPGDPTALELAYQLRTMNAAAVDNEAERERLRRLKLAAIGIVSLIDLRVMR